MAPKEESQEKMEVEKDAEIKKEVDKAPPKPRTFKENLTDQLEELSTVKHSRDYRPVLSTLKRLTKLRRECDRSILARIVTDLPADDNDAKAQVLAVCGEPKVEEEIQDAQESPDHKASFTPEVELFVWLLASISLFDSGKIEESRSALEGLFRRGQEHNKRTLDPFTAKAFYFFSLIFEKKGMEGEVRSLLLSAHRTSCLRKDEIGEATIINLIVRNYLRSNLVEQASKFVSKATFPENSPNSEWARHLYYLGRIKAVQLDYSGGISCLVQALRKAPQPPRALGFRAEVQKLSCLVQLLKGEIPERSSFFTQEKGMNSLMRPYFELVLSVRNGNVLDFQAVVQKHKEVFDADANTPLVLRLRHNVIKVGLRNINLAYSKISIDDICAKCGIQSRGDAEAIVAKAIRDGVIDAVIDHKEGYVRSKDIGDIYSTTEPQIAFRRRIDFCMQLHNDAIKAMKYPPKKGQDIEKMEKHLREQIDDADLIDELLNEDED
eukprot:CAMPEP_0113875372 /NCGR_PEP_ID=MMETSP0780_2-20120614/4913_1 /TAXON_ID=652834 /ORGANISM="Palpitomonas bilix" /LENGTH=493 /DNA_ID=CAMNT_0000861369 /DNA_START=106 /DNA_END=1587 /DNA_ORIENTATION=- /assembly_acc=CAM_ASM_000599